MRGRIINTSLLVDLHQSAAETHSTSPKRRFPRLDRRKKTLFTLSTNSPRSLASPREAIDLDKSGWLDKVQQNRAQYRNTRANAAICERAPHNPLKIAQRQWSEMTQTDVLFSSSEKALLQADDDMYKTNSIHTRSKPSLHSRLLPGE